MTAPQKKQRVENKIKPIPSKALERLGLRDDLPEALFGVAVDNTRGYLYVFMSNPYLRDGGPIVRQIRLSTAPQLVSTLKSSVSEFLAFPPGILPVIAAYADTEGETCWDVALSCQPTIIDEVKLDEVSGQLICSVWENTSFIKVFPNGTLQYVHQVSDFDPISCDMWTLVSGTCIVADSRDLWELDWKGAYYSIRPLMPIVKLPEHTRAFLMDDRHVYFIEGYTSIRQLPRYAPHPPSESKVLFESVYDELATTLVWCGPKHILFGLIKTDTYALYLLSLDTLSARCLISHLTYTTHSRVVDDLGFCYTTRHSRGPCIIVRVINKLYILPVHI